MMREPPAAPAVAGLQVIDQDAANSGYPLRHAGLTRDRLHPRDACLSHRGWENAPIHHGRAEGKNR